MSQTDIIPKHTVNYAKLKDPENLREIKSFQKELEKTNGERLDFILKSVSEVRSDLESLKAEIFNNSVKEPANADYLKRKMLDIEAKISYLKEVIQQEFLASKENETSLFNELKLLERRIVEWDKPLNSRIFKPIKRSVYKVQSGINDNPTTEFQKFLTTNGGHCGGWIEQDHLLFLRERKKYKGKEKFFKVIHSLLPDLTYDDIVEHENWYTKYEALKNSQKEAIQKWKTEKKENQNHKKENLTEKKEIVSNKKVVQQKNIAERIKRWKEQQLVKKIEEEERQKIEKQKIQEEERRKKEMQEAKKLAVNAYKAEKLNKIQNGMLSQKDNKHHLVDSKAKNKVLLESFRLQDIKFIEKKKIIRLQLESKANDKVEKLRLTKPALEYILQRDPQRIFQPTLIWSQHCQQNDKKEKTNPVFDLNSIPKLAIPEWRRELK